jgi:hypothetical protein
MADYIYSTQTIVATTGGTASIDIPSARQSSDSVVYLFSSMHSGTIELVQNSGDTEGIEILSGTQYQSGPWRINSGPPRFLYTAEVGGQICRITVVVEK